MSIDIKIGLFGFGCVGQGLFHVLHETQGIKGEIVKIVVKDPHKKRTLPTEWFSYDKNEILQHPEINLVIELIDDAEEAYHIVKAALQSGKHVITANKKMLAFHLEELIALQKKHGVSLLYEGAACGSIPIIRNLEEYYDNDLLNGVYGIFNGSTNYILSKIFHEKSDYTTALKKAQELGFAESDPALDVEGFDPLFKLIILTAHSFGILLDPGEVFHLGITGLTENDLRYATEKGRKIKLIAGVHKLNKDKIASFVLPSWVAYDNNLYNVENEYNAVNVEATFSDKQLLVGKGAGGNPTGSAVLSDIAALSHDYKYEYKKIKTGNSLQYTTDIKLEIYLRYHREEELAQFDFTKISEKYVSNSYRYVVGEISLAELIKNKEFIQNHHLFVVNTGSLLQLN